MSEAMHGSGLSLRSPRRRRSVEERRLIVEETLEAGSSVGRVALKHGVNANPVFKWRRLHEAGRLGTRAARAVQLLPVHVAEETLGSR
jgi:transposase